MTTITKRTLEKWRTEALSTLARKADTETIYEETAPTLVRSYLETQTKILRLTQVLLDQQLLVPKK